MLRGRELNVSTLRPSDPLAVAVVEAIHAGDVQTLRRLLDENPGLATARFGDDRPGGMTRTLLHVATDWPGHFPSGAKSVAVLVAAGADVNARFTGPHAETPLHWAASSDDVEVLDALLDEGADIEAPGGVIGGGPPLADEIVDPGAVDLVFSALANPTRRRVVERLSGSPASVSELAEPFDMALPSFLQHLDVLEESGLVRSRKEGRVRTCRLDSKPLRLAEDWLERQRALWESRLDRFDAYVTKLQEDDR